MAQTPRQPPRRAAQPPLGMPGGRPTFGSLFSGGGGWDLGLMQAGFAHVFGVEIDPEISKVYESQIGPVDTLDVRSIQRSTLPKVDMLVASPPCQDYSSANTNRKSSCNLGLYVAGIAGSVEAKVVIVENVAAYLRSPVLAQLSASMKALGYQKYTTTFDATWFGVPQSRKRCFAMYSRVGLPELPSPVPHDGWFAAIHDLIPFDAPDATLPPWQHKFVPSERHDWLLTHGSACRNGIIRWAHEPAWTVVASRHCLTNSRLVAPNGDVYRVTPRMFARWQSFPDSYAPVCSQTTFYRVIGNAVPPQVAYNLAKLFLPLIKP